jgi:hypothetical protein
MLFSICRGGRLFLDRYLEKTSFEQNLNRSTAFSADSGRQSLHIIIITQNLQMRVTLLVDSDRLELDTLL